MPRWQQQWTDAEVQEIIALKRAGLNYRQIGEQVNRSMWAVRERLRCCDPNYYERKIKMRNERRGSRALSSPDPVEGNDEQPSYWRDAAAANRAFLELLHLHHPEHAPCAYNAEQDFGASINACYDAVKARIAAGGEPWIPKP